MVNSSLLRYFSVSRANCKNISIPVLAYYNGDYNRCCRLVERCVAKRGIRLEAVYFCAIAMPLTHCCGSVCVATRQADNVCLICRAICNLPYQVTCAIIRSYPIRSQVRFLGSLPEINLHHNALLQPPFLCLLPSFFTLLTNREVETPPRTFPLYTALILLRELYQQQIPHYVSAP